MRRKKLSLRLFLDEGVPDSVGEAFAAAGHQVMFLRKNLATGSPDHLVCAFAEVNDAILVALDGDMKTLARGHGATKGRFKKLSLIKLSCRETKAADRVKAALSLIEHEWVRSADRDDRRIFIDIMDQVIRTLR